MTGAYLMSVLVSGHIAVFLPVTIFQALIILHGTHEMFRTKHTDQLAIPFLSWTREPRFQPNTLLKVCGIATS